MSAFKRLRLACTCLLFCVASATGLSAQKLTLTTLVNFANTDGATPTAGMVQGTDGNFYGTTSAGGNSSNCDSGCGTIFKVTPQGALTTLHNFQGTDGSAPYAALIQASDGNFYGTTSSGGGSDYCFEGCGTIFKMTPSGDLTTLHSFEGTDGGGVFAGLIQASDGNLYGVTEFGGETTCVTSPGCGTIFKITTGGTLTTLYFFSSTGGRNPAGGLVQAADGTFYGTTQFGGANNGCQTEIGCGTVFTITAGGTLNTIYNFCGKKNCRDGAVPNGALVLGNDGRFYSTTYGGGSNNSDGTVYALTTAGALTTLHRFQGGGLFDPVGLALGSDGDFYGTGVFAGRSQGSIYKITPTGLVTVLHRFQVTDGANPGGVLVQGTDGNFYGTTEDGGANGYGTVFRLSVGTK